MALAAAVAAPLLAHVDASGEEWAAFAVFSSCAAVAQLFTVQTPRNHGFQTTNVFLIPAILLLPAPLVALLALVQHVPEWLNARKAWYVQSFNIANYTLNALAAHAVAHAVEQSSLIGSTHARDALAGVAAAVVFVVLNHLLLAIMLNLARGYSLLETGLFSFDGLSTELVLAGLGVGVATFWRLNPWLIPFALAPLALIHRSLAVPQLQAEARVDPKTGLFNARHFAAALAEELARAERFARPLSLIMADLDLLREINNSYGHLAGDAVIKGIAEVFRAELRDYDVPARFGGEEFSILLPETPPAEAMAIAERIRRAVAAKPFDVETSGEPIRATVSIGVAGFPGDGHDANELIHQADLAVYRAKLQGRNRVLGVSSDARRLPVAL
jgi:diguanylate cyclase (GGDEF)-like protein